MLGFKSPVVVVTSLTMLGLGLFAVTTARAQTPNVTVEKPVVEASTPVTASTAKVPATVTKTSDAAEAKPAETGVAKTDPAAPTKQGTAQAAPTPPPCPAGTRLVKADVVAIPKAIMLNRL